MPWKFLVGYSCFGTFINEAPSDVSIILDGSSYPGCLVLIERAVFLAMKKAAWYHPGSVMSRPIVNTFWTDSVHIVCPRLQI